MLKLIYALDQGARGGSNVGVGRLTKGRFIRTRGPSSPSVACEGFFRLLTPVADARGRGGGLGDETLHGADDVPRAGDGPDGGRGPRPGRDHTYNFTGSVTSVNDGTAFALNGTIPFGTAVIGSFSYDAAAPASISTPNQATYPTAPVAFSVNVGGRLKSSSRCPLGGPGHYAMVSDGGVTDAWLAR